MHPLSPKTRQHVHSLGIRIDIQDTRNAAAQYNLLAKERGTDSVAAAMVPFGFVEGLGYRGVR
jgi:NADH dehydrogenase [ubiquinone] 1 alpha subcomplex assembly factor 3